MSSDEKSEERREAAAELATMAGIPTGWDVRVTADCKVYYVDHSTQSTQWMHPVDKIRRYIKKEMPAGWQRDRDQNGVRMYTHDASGRKTYLDPRIVILFDEGKVRNPSKLQVTIDKPKRRRAKKRKPEASTENASPMVNGDVPTSNDNDSDSSSSCVGNNVVPGTHPHSTKTSAEGSAGSSTASSSSPDATSESSPFDRHSTGMQVADEMCGPHRGKCAVITGANSGIGFETARCLALSGLHVILACRSVASASDAADRIRQMKDGCRIDVMELDLSSLQSIHRFVTDYKRHGWPLSLLICCASVMGVPYSESRDGVEMHFAVNHLGHFYLTKLLTPILCQSAPSRVIVVTSELHRIASLSGTSIDFDRDIPITRSAYWPILAYNQSKLCNLLFANELQRRLRPRRVQCVAVHPGMTSTALTRHSTAMKAVYTVLWPFTKSVEQAAATVVYGATCPSLDDDTLYLADCQRAEPAEEALDPSLAEHLWRLSEVLCSTADPKQLYIRPATSSV